MYLEYASDSHHVERNSAGTSLFSMSNVKARSSERCSLLRATSRSPLGCFWMYARMAFALRNSSCIESDDPNDPMSSPI